MKTLLINIFAAFSAIWLTVACTSVDEPSVGQTEHPPLVVEGWIEEGEPPIVAVTRAVDLTSETASFDSLVQRWCRVSVFDGDTRYILTGRKDTTFMPPYVYTSTRLRGKVGHTYRLLVETDTDTVEGMATLSAAPRITALESVPVQGSDSLFVIRAYIDGLDQNAAYKFFTRDYDRGERYFGSFSGTFTGREYNAENGWTISRGIHDTYDEAYSENFSHYFASGTRVQVKLCSLDSSMYEFWRVYDSSVSLSQNLFFTFAENCRGNLVGGLGYWAAYGVSRRNITVR